MARVRSGRESERNGGIERRAGPSGAATAPAIADSGPNRRAKPDRRATGTQTWATRTGSYGQRCADRLKAVSGLSLPGPSRPSRPLPEVAGPEDGPGGLGPRAAGSLVSHGDAGPPTPQWPAPERRRHGPSIRGRRRPPPPQSDGWIRWAADNESTRGAR